MSDPGGDAVPHPMTVDHPWFSRWYVRTEHAVERAVGEARRAQNAQALGRTLIIGAGSGLDVPALGPGTTNVVLLEPDATMRRILGQRYPSLPVVGEPAEAMRLDSGSMDTVISSLVLCSVADLRHVFDEIARVLRPGGQYLFLEHVANPRWLAGSVQRAVDQLWRRMGGGCHLTRDVVLALAESPLQPDGVEPVHQGGLLPVIRGQATAPGIDTGRALVGTSDVRNQEEGSHPLRWTRLSRPPIA